VSDPWNPGIAFSSLSDVGMRRANNQDSMACVPASTEERFETHGHLFVVADGMGAHAAGELASAMATEKIAMHYFRSASESSSDALQHSLIEANSEIHRRGQSNPEFHNMGTTASSLILIPDGAVVAHVGDSRVYRLRQNVFEQLTFDHSLVWEMEASAQLRGGVVGEGIPRNVITRSLGPHESVEVDIEGPFPIEIGDRFLICSDGLTGLVDDTEIGVLVDCLPEELATRVLVDLANLRGGPDNITVIVVRIEGEPEPQQASGLKPIRRTESMATPAMAIATGLCFALAGLLATLRLSGVIQSWGPVIVASILAGIAAVVTGVVFFGRDKEGIGHIAASGGKGPYRRYDARPTKEMFERLAETVQALRDAANEKNWMIDWSKVDDHQKQGAKALSTTDAKSAIRHQSEAIIETMNQLRDQHDRSASETAVDQ
jgi:serine/threonine protein phosphatase PrpC